jgi:membrane protease YdiL (CAAX protease family)
MNVDVRTQRKVLLDRHFLIALLLGPAVWLLLSTRFSQSGQSIALQTIAVVVLIYPILEELAFRGFLQSWLYEHPRFRKHLVSGISIANLLTSVSFAAAHLLSQPPLWAAAIFFPSLVFGYFRDRFDLVWPSILLHCWYNAGFVYLFY